MRLRSTLAAAAFALSLASPALADITVLEGAAPGALDPVNFDNGDTGFLITGVVGPADAEVTFNGAESLVVQGQSLEAVAGTFNFLLFTLADAGLAFTAAQFNLDAADAGTTTIFAYDQFGNAFGGGFSLAANGGNVFSVLATSGQYIQSIVVMSDADLDDVSQIRLGGIAALVPEPASWGLMILGFGAAGAMLRFRRAHAAA
ncbi:MAG: PEPxxWA-CTERM sorting domain-containing protein [Phenylobacterium sp.]|uniref:PEPxxWA-CTERM sorting domain-containing protein n=1 Tax=Phenylobacterium sp. TaxID=1871053 RepID=UPI001A2295DF|nr:PEPxxWA-CTERM sorting domain-containing protein [Phenylobacterium sp.]MBJ7411122.1 PEPxxWA-CTERM sorting domain-containing protein [Phenylobacterium sp.]